MCTETSCYPIEICMVSQTLLGIANDSHVHCKHSNGERASPAKLQSTIGSRAGASGTAATVLAVAVLKDICLVVVVAFL